MRVDQRRVDEVGVVVVHAGAEDRRHPRRGGAWHDAKRGGDGDRRDELQAVAHLQSQEIGQPAADHDGEIVAEAFEAAPVDGLVVVAATQGPIALAHLRRPLDRGGKRRARPEVVGLHAAQDHAADALAGHGHDLALDRGRRADDASRPFWLPWTPSWPLMLDIWRSISTRKPFITDMTTISVPTPSVMPISEKPAMTEMKPSSRRARR